MVGNSAAKFRMAKADWTDTERDIITLSKRVQNATNEGQILLKDKPERFPSKID